MLHDLTPASSAMFDHLRARFPGRDVAMLPPAPRPTHERVPALHILSATPPERGRLYATAGLWDATQVDGHGLEFVLRALAAEDRVHVETLTMVAYVHSGGGHHALDHGHTVPIGRPWMRRSRCNHLLVSLPYPWGEDFETCPVPGGHVRVLWPLPVTAAEKTFRHAHGLEALEQRFEDAGIFPTDPGRPSVVPERGRLLRAVPGELADLISCAAGQWARVGQTRQFFQERLGVGPRCPWYREP